MVRLLHLWNIWKKKKMMISEGNITCASDDGLKMASWIILLDLKRLHEVDWIRNSLEVRSAYNVTFTAFLEHLVASLLLVGKIGSSSAAELSTRPQTNKRTDLCDGSNHARINSGQKEKLCLLFGSFGP